MTTLWNRHENGSVDAPKVEIAITGMDTTLVIHIMLQVVVYTLIIPTGMVLGMIKSKWHIPVQTAGIILTTVACFLGMTHGGKQYPANLHSKTGLALMLMLLLQAAGGIYIRSQKSKGSNSRIKSLVLRTHRIVGQLMVLLSWGQMVNGYLTAANFCGRYYFSNCLTHSVFGLAFISHAIFWLILLHSDGRAWLRRTGRSVDFFDAMHLGFWGVVNTFTEHNWGHSWTGHELEHTSVGMLWWFASALFVWQTYKRSPQPKRSPMGGVIFTLSGWILTQHPQPFPTATKYHVLLGDTLMACGVVRIIEVVFICKDKDPAYGKGEVNSFQYLTIYLCFATGFMFLGATLEQIRAVRKSGMPTVTYMICLHSLAFLLFLFASILLHLYDSNSRRLNQNSDISRNRDALDKGDKDVEMEGLLADD